MRKGNTLYKDFALFSMSLLINKLICVYIFRLIFLISLSNQLKPLSTYLLFFLFCCFWFLDNHLTR
jgi:hypothetical protein